MILSKFSRKRTGGWNKPIYRLCHTLSQFKITNRETVAACCQAICTQLSHCYCVPILWLIFQRDDYKPVRSNRNIFKQLNEFRERESIAESNCVATTGGQRVCKQWLNKNVWNHWFQFRRILIYSALVSLFATGQRTKYNARLFCFVFLSLSNRRLPFFNCPAVYSGQSIEEQAEANQRLVGLIISCWAGDGWPEN